MKTLRLLIVDDEALIRRGIRKALASLQTIEVCGECENGTDAIQAILETRPDLVLLDVQMPDCNGLEVVRQIGAERMPMVVFVTAYDEYAVRAFELNAVDYLLKPFDEERLKDAIGRAQQRLDARNNEKLTQQLQTLLDTNAMTWPERFVVRNRDRYEFVAVDSVDWVESANNYVELHCGAKSHLMSDTLSRLEKRLDPRKFVRVHLPEGNSGMQCKL